MLDYERWLADGALFRLRQLIENARMDFDPNVGDPAAKAAQGQAQNAISDLHDSITPPEPFPTAFEEANYWAGFDERLRVAVVTYFNPLFDFEYPAPPYFHLQLKRFIRESEDATRMLNRSALAIADYVSV
jgi:hypothetical protein